MEKVNKSPKDTPTKMKKNNKDVKKKDESSKEEKQDINIHTSSTNKEVAKEAKEQQKETPVKEVKEVAKEVTIPQLSNKESKKTKRKNDLLSQIGKFLTSFYLLMFITPF